MTTKEKTNKIMKMMTTLQANQALQAPAARHLNQMDRKIIHGEMTTIRLLTKRRSGKNKNKSLRLRLNKRKSHIKKNSIVGLQVLMRHLSKTLIPNLLQVKITKKKRSSPGINTGTMEMEDSEAEEVQVEVAEAQAGEEDSIAEEVLTEVIVVTEEEEVAAVEEEVAVTGASMIEEAEEVVEVEEGADEEEDLDSETMDLEAETTVLEINKTIQDLEEETLGKGKDNKTASTTI